ncbi:low-specificity L-threonine aldolase [Akkermansiaceae bacterium]|nr:low-specificity L-threonine aldolase [Akkermansiaceae bacterium]MDB4544378.1 low-specificity L-threonine aldolase [Akkermansiaceae bacterium]
MLIDLRSDTVTRPTPSMKEAMGRAEVGDDVFGDDPTVARLEDLAAGMLGKEAGMFVPSGTQSNLCALLTHCQRGDEYIVGQTAHTYLFEGGGAAVFGSIQPQPIDQADDGTLDLDKVAALVKPDDFHFARTRLLCLENTSWGKVLPLAYLEAVRPFVEKHGLSLHLDGARIFNASVASGMPASQLVEPFDSVSICLSKGLGAPVGSVLIGSVDFIKAARRWRKMLGGGMRQSGVLAAAGIYALENHVAQLSEDHANARVLAEGLSTIPCLTVDPVQTNMVFVEGRGEKMNGLAEKLRETGVLIGSYTGGKMRLVSHLDISSKDIEVVIAGFHKALA